MAEVSDAELALIIEALEEASFFRDARSRVVDRAIKRQERRGSSRVTSGTPEGHREKARAFTALALKLKGARRAN